MTIKKSIGNRITSLFLAVAILFSMIPITAMTANAAAVSSSSVTGSVADPGTADTWEQMMGSSADGNRYAGRVWTDKSVYTDGQTAKLNSRGEVGSTFEVKLEDDEAFQVIFSVLGSSMTSKETVSASGPLDVVLILDDSTSMDDIISGNITRLQKLIEASNGLLADLLTSDDIRIGIVAYNQNAIQILPFGRYENGIELRVRDGKYTFDENSNRDKGGTIQAFDNDGTLLYNNTSGYARGTNTQAGFDMGMRMLENATDTEGREPIAILLTDGAANTAAQKTFYDIASQTPRAFLNNTVPSSVVLATLLNASYRKASVEDVYGKAPMIYGIGVDIAGNAEANAVINPGADENGFSASHSSSYITRAYEMYEEWLKGKTVKRTESYNGNHEFVFDHGYTSVSNVTLEDIKNNINYVDSYYPVSSAELEEAFTQIYEEISSGVFNPISSSTIVDGATGVDDTPLIYVDYIGQYMEIKEIQSVTLFGSSYNVVKKGDGTYTVSEGIGKNPTTGEDWNTSEDILISVSVENGIQKLEIRINQEILPILMEQVISNTVSGETTATINEVIYDPLRVFYTVGIDSDILLPNGEIDVSEIQGYEFIDNDSGTVSFYSNQFGVMNPASEGVVTEGDAHVGFQPSAANRYYYHQANQGVFSKVTNADGSAVQWEDGLYGVVYEADKYNLTYLTYDEYKSLKDDDQVYTYVSFYRPTETTSDAANAAELVTYLVYTNWGDLKESVAFYDRTNGVFINYDGASAYTTGDVGYAVDAAVADAMISAYKASNADANIVGMLGMGSLRTSRFHNMISEKTSNPTGTATLRYAPEYTHETAELHNGNSVIVWLGNNGKITVAIDTGIALTKSVTETIGKASDTYALTVTIPAGVSAVPVVTDKDGNDVTASISTYLNNVLTVNLKAGETVYISGIPGGTECAIGENIPDSADYYIASKTDSVTVPTVSQVLNGKDQFVAASVTNAPNKYGNLLITKEITGDYEIPDSILEKEFSVTVNLGAALAGKTFTVNMTDGDDPTGSTTTTTVGDDGTVSFAIKARQTIEIEDIPAGTEATVTESNPGTYFTVSYRTRNHSSADADADNKVQIPEDGNATAVIDNRYKPNSTTVDLDIAGTKNFTIEGNHDGGKFNFKVQKWNETDDVWEDINGKTASVSYDVNTSGEKTFTIEDVLNGIEYTHVGSWAYQVLEVKGEVANVTYDRTLYTFAVTVTDNGGQLVATVTDLHNTAITDGSYEVTFENTYHTAPVSMDIVKVIKDKSGNPATSALGFKFRSVAVNENGEPLNAENPETATNTIYSNANGDARIAGVYDTAGTYYYIVYEENTGVKGWDYSEAEYFITVVVTADDEGNLSSVMTIVPWNDAARAETAPSVANSNEGKLYFTNTYDPDDVTVNIDGAVAKELSGKTLTADMFSFYVFKNNEGYLRNYDNALLSGTNDLNGDVNFVDFNNVLTFDKVGKYEYDIVEYIPANAVLNNETGVYELNGMSYDPTIYDLVVEVSLDTTTGKLEADYYFEDATGLVATFNNSYTVTPTTYQLGGQKTLDGRAIQAGEFSFALYAGNTWIETVTNKADGSFNFSAIEYTEAGTYEYTIKEIEPATKAPGVNYDGVNTPVSVTVTVTDTNGVLSASANVSNADISFKNTYNADSVFVSFGAHKTLEGETLEADMFYFELYETDQHFEIPTGAGYISRSTSAANGNASLGGIEFNKTGTYFYAIIEDTTTPLEGYVYDSAQHNYIVTVRDVGMGKLIATVTKVGGSQVSGTGSVAAPIANFTNATFGEVVGKEVAYREDSGNIYIDGQKVEVGEILTYFITYTNYTGESAVVDIMDTIPKHTSYVEGSASHNGSYAGTHLLWVLNVADGESVTVSFDVKVDETEVIITNQAVIRDGVNEYTTNEVVNHTVDENLVKDVFSPDDVTVSIDGKKVYEGDELLYKVSFTNANPDTVDIEITDVIPAYTTYVDGSADNGGVFAGGKLVWNLDNVPAWATVTVSFKVTVNENVGAVTIENQATATDGTNQYKTNIVTNYTVEDEVEKKVFAAGNTDVNIDGKKVYEGDELTYTISYKNTADENATVTITDNIPQYTTYVDASADNGGAYDNGVITWNLEVAAGESVTVSFKVTVNTDIADKTLSNEATIVEGKNTYKTNEVTNYTVYDEVEKDVFLASNDDISIDGKKVYAGDILLYTVSYTNSAKENATVTITDKIPEFTTYVDGSADNNGVYADGVITWTKEVAAESSITVSFKVKVSNTDNVEIKNKADVKEGKNTYETNEVTNYTVDDEVVKDVFSAEAPEISIDGKKVYAGDTLIYEVTYENTDTEKVSVTITDKIPEHTVYVDGSADNGGVYANGVITWNLEVEADSSVTVAFKVKVEDAGNVTISNKAEVKEGRNTYWTNEVTNYTVDDEVSKDVFSVEAPEISIDGKKVYAGDTLIYEVTYKNTDSEKVTVTITDAIPEHTVYVDGSADNGGVYANGVITWRLEVNANSSVTVSFKVKVEDAGNVTIINKAEVKEGRNTYETNEVTNYTVDDDVEKKVFAENNTDIEIDGKKVYAGDILLYTISYTNSAKESATVIITDKIPEFTEYVDGSADNNGVYADGVITWTLEVAAESSITVSFKVKVSDDDNAVIKNMAEIKEGKNTYETNEVTNYTVEDEVSKDVFSAEAPEISIDGKKVYAGDTLIYEVTYQNTDTEKVSVTITDAIPEHTIYVDGSADNNGVYADGVITWNLEVEAGASVTVSFKVKVEDAGNVTIINKAEVKEGRNTYWTNEVTNYTVDDEVVKDVFSAEAPEISIDGKKVYVGDTLVYYISYTNSATEKATVKITDAIPEHTAYVDGSADNGGVYADGVITWELEVEPGATVSVSFKVTVKDNAKTATITNKATVLEGKNTYETNEVTNYTTEDEVKKQVFDEKAPTVNIDGKDVKYGDTLVYAISYKNTSSEKVTVTITDTVPQYTTYVDGSADNGGVYKDGVITWTLDVEAGETVTVTFKVKVDWVQSATITNKAVVMEGKNTYTTNEVSNPTENTVPDIPDNPQTGDNSNLSLWVALMFVSGGAALTLCVYDRKKRKQENV